jgi:hypothetical protein
MVLGMTIRAVAIMRPISQIVGASLLPSGVPEIDTGHRYQHVRNGASRLNGQCCIQSSSSMPQQWCLPSALMGTDSGCSGSVASVCSRPIRS